MAVLKDVLEQFGGENYLHYYGSSDMATLNYTRNISKMNKALLMQNSYKGLQNRLKDVKDNIRNSVNASTEEDKKIVESILDGSVFKGMGQIGYTEATLGNLPYPETFEECQSILNNIDANTVTIAEFVDKLYEVTAKITGNNRDLLEKYAEEIISKAVYNQNDKKGSVQGRIGKVQREGGTVSQAIIDSILTKHNQSFFQLNGSGMGLHTDVVKMLALAKALPDPSSASRTYAVATGSSSNIIKEDLSENQILTYLKDKIKKWMVELEKNTAEAAIVAAALKEKKEVFSRFGKADEVIRRTQSENVRTIFIPDPKQERYINMTNSTLLNRNWKVYKSDVIIQLTPDGAVGVLGISVKDYENIKITGNEGIHSISGSLDIQKGSSLLTLLMREAGISGARLHQIAQFAGAHTYGGERGEGVSGNWDDVWHKMIQNLTYRMLVDALVGLKGTNDTAGFFAINGWIYDVGDFINSFIHSAGSSVKMEEYLGKWGQNKSTGGLERQSYVALNTWVGPVGRRNPYLALKRSPKAENAIINLMQNTKITISLNLLNMGGLTPLNM